VKSIKQLGVIPTRQPANDALVSGAQGCSIAGERSEYSPRERFLRLIADCIADQILSPRRARK
jgi:hypothetical protein